MTLTSTRKVSLALLLATLVATVFLTGVARADAPPTEREAGWSTYNSDVRASEDAPAVAVQPSPPAAMREPIQPETAPIRPLATISTGLAEAHSFPFMAGGKSFLVPPDALRTLSSRP
jgi:hypothetical protein